jgi:hypothetical protein
MPTLPVLRLFTHPCLEGTPSLIATTVITYPSLPNRKRLGMRTSRSVPSCIMWICASSFCVSLSVISTATAPASSAVIVLDTKEQSLKSFQTDIMIRPTTIEKICLFPITLDFNIVGIHGFSFRYTFIGKCNGMKTHGFWRWDFKIGSVTKNYFSFFQIFLKSNRCLEWKIWKIKLFFMCLIII